jgi:hypothetical protein
MATKCTAIGVNIVAEAKSGNMKVKFSSDLMKLNVQDRG